MFHDLALIFFCWVFSSFWILVTLPYISQFCDEKLADGGWALNRALGWLGIGLPIWYLSHFGLPINTRSGIWFVFFIALLFSFYWSKKNNFKFSEFFKKHKELIITEEILFLFGIFFLSIIRGYSPEINSLEKFMDGGLIISYIKSPILPIEDMWLAGMNFNYYTFGHFLGAVATQFWGIDPVISYNVLLGLLMGLTLQLSFSLVVNTSSFIMFKPTKPVRKKLWLFEKLFPNHSPYITPLTLKPLIVIGLIGAYLVTFAGNTQTIWYLIARCHSQMTQTPVQFSPADEERTPVIAEACSFVGYWYPNATRFIPRTIHEFPSYSFIVSDLHAHVWNLPQIFVLLTFVLLWSQFLVESITTGKKARLNQKTFLSLNILLGVLMGSFVMTSTWDGLVYGLFFCIFSSLLLLFYPRLFKHLFLSGILIGFTMLVSSSPWWLNFDSISEGAAISPEHSQLWQLVVLWIGHLTFGGCAALFTIQTIRKTKTNVQVVYLFILGLALSGLSLIVLPEVMYIKDIYTTQPRANTMFKLTYQAFIQLSLLGGIALAYFHSKISFPKPVFGIMLFVLLMVIGCVGIYPYFGYRDYYLGGQATYKGLDGLNWMRETTPNDYQAYLWLKRNVEGRPHILEAVGDSYTTFARMSTFSGLPTVLGWRVHEWLWRGSYDIPGKRSGEVESIYNSPLSAESLQLLNEYQVRYIIVGDKEKEAYPNMDTSLFSQLGKVVFREGNTFIIER